MSKVTELDVNKSQNKCVDHTKEVSHVSLNLPIFLSRHILNPGPNQYIPFSRKIAFQCPRFGKNIGF